MMLGNLTKGVLGRDGKECLEDGPVSARRAGKGAPHLLTGAPHIDGQFLKGVVAAFPRQSVLIRKCLVSFAAGHLFPLS